MFCLVGGGGWSNILLSWGRVVERRFAKLGGGVGRYGWCRGGQKEGKGSSWVWLEQGVDALSRDRVASDTRHRRRE